MGPYCGQEQDCLDALTPAGVSHISRAIVAALTATAPAFVSASAQADSVEPVVITSSTNTTETPLNAVSCRAAKAPATLVNLCSAPRVT